MNVTQCRMARAALGWSWDDLAKEAGISRRTIAKFEADARVADQSVAKLRKAFEREGVVFIPHGMYLGGVVPPVQGR
jgi:transcriptional regulator with XRE-family HTH domain